MKVKNLICTLVVILFMLLQLNAQDTTVHVVQDLESWTAARFEYKLNKKLKFNIGYNLRLEHNSSQLNQHFTEFSANYKLHDFVSLNGELRYGLKLKNSGQTEQYMTFFYASKFQYDFNRFEINARIAYQNRNVLGSGITDLTEPQYVLRYRIGLDYNIKGWKLDPKFSYELFRDTRITDPQFYKYRLRLGTEYSLKKAGEIDLFLAHERELNASYPLNATIIGATYTFSTKRKKKEQKDED